MTLSDIVSFITDKLSYLGWKWPSVGAVVTALWTIWSKVINPRLKRRKLERAFGNYSFDKEQIEQAANNYIEPDCTQLDPAGAEDDRKLVAVREPLIPLMDNLLSEPGFRRHYLLLADSGMGKTSFLLNYYLRNQKKRRSQRHRIVLIPLGRKGALNNVRTVSNKKETILFLDAFDEDTAAIEDHKSRLHEIMRDCEDFKRLVMSCRTQFFSQDEEIPKETGIARVGPRRGGEGRIYEFQKLYLAPFTLRQVEAYLRRCFPLYYFLRRGKARKIVDALPELSTRPMLLALVPELVESRKEIKELFELYEFMVDKWLEREAGWIDPLKMREFSIELAVDLYLRRGERGSERIPLVELASLIKLNNTVIEQWKLTGRSLLNRDAAGQFKFAHRSIMEYLFICAFIGGNEICLSVAWTDVMRQLFVSWANVCAKRNQADVLYRLLGNDFTRTGIFPILEHPRGPVALGRADILNAPRKARVISLYRSLEGLARGTYVSAHPIGDTVYLCDRASDAVFLVQIDWRAAKSGSVDTELWALFNMTRAEMTRQCDALNYKRVSGRDDWRPPTLEELDILFVSNSRLSVLDPGGYYWSSDTSEQGDQLIACFSERVGDLDPRVRKIGERRVKLPGGEDASYVVLESPVLGFRRPNGVYDNTLKARLVPVSQGGADKFAAAADRLLRRSI